MRIDKCNHLDHVYIIHTHRYAIYKSNKLSCKCFSSECASQHFKSALYDPHAATYTIYTTRHPGEASGLIDGHLVLKILTCGLPQVSGLKTSPHCLNKPFHALRGCRLPQSTILIARVYKQSIRKHPHCCGAFLQYHYIS